MMISLKNDSTTARICRLLTLVAFLLWLLSTIEARNSLVQRGIGDFGLITILPITFFISVSLLTCSFLANLRSNGDQISLFLQTIILVFMLNLTPTLIEGTVRFAITYPTYSSVDYIVQKGFLNQSELRFHNWPGLPLVYSALVEVTNLPAQMLLTTYPAFSEILVFFPLYALYEVLLSDAKHKWLAIWILYVTNWIGQNYFSAQSLGFFIYALMLSLILKMETKPDRRICIVLITLFSLLVTTHLLSAVFVLTLLGVFFLFKYFDKGSFLAFCIVLAASWIVYGAATFFEWDVPTLIRDAFQFELIYGRTARRLGGSESHAGVSAIRVVFSMIVFAFAVSGIARMWKNKEIESLERRILATLAATICPIVMFVYGGELIMRAYMFSLIPLAYFISRNSNHKMFFAFLVIFITVIAPPLHMIAHYGNEVMDYTEVSEMRGSDFFYDRTTRGYLIGSEPKDWTYRSAYRFFRLSKTEWRSGKLTIPLLENPSLPNFVCITKFLRQRYNLLLGNPKLIHDLVANLTQSIHYNKIYSNPSLEVYVER